MCFFLYLSRSMNSRVLVNNHVQWVDQSAYMVKPNLPSQEAIVVNNLQPQVQHKTKVNDLIIGQLPALTTPRSFDVPDIVIQPEYMLRAEKGLDKRHIMTIQMERQQIVSESMKPVCTDIVMDPRYTFVMPKTNKTAIPRY
jgi:hypothetical protein